MEGSEDIFVVFCCLFFNLLSRDHGLASYTAWARHCGLLGEGGGWAGLRTLVGFAHVVNALKCNAPFQISDQGQLRRLESVYGSPDSVDVWVGPFYLAF